MDTYEEEIVKKSSRTKDEHRRFILKIIGIAFVVSLLGGGAAALASYLTLRSAAEDGTQLAAQIQQACESPGVVDPDLAQFCPRAEEVVDSAPTEVRAVAGEDGEDGVDGQDGVDGAPGPGPTAEQTLLAVTRYCNNTNNCDGENPTASQVASAVAIYCNSRGNCQGPVGRAGVDGQDADPVTQEQLIQSVAAYCTSNGGCRGPAGPQGPQGAQGQQGAPGQPGVASVQDSCGAAPEGQTIANVDADYNAETRTITLTCTYKDDEQVIEPPGQG